MSEESAIQNTPFPLTRASLARDLKTLGVRQGMTLLVHSALSRIGWVCGGPVAVVQALMDVVTEEGTLVMPTFSTDYSNPETWRHPPVPKEWVGTIKETMPAFSPVYTPTREMGRIVECFRDFPGVSRSDHPAVSFAAWGNHRDTVTKDHHPDYSLGDASPLGKVYALDGYVLLLGVSYERCTSFHLAEYRTGVRTRVPCEAPMIEGGRRVWKAYQDIELDVSEFPVMGEHFEKEGGVRKGLIGLAESLLFSQRRAVDFAAAWLRKGERE